MSQDRLLIPANPSIGVLRHKEHHYAFSSRDAAMEFAMDPDKYVKQQEIIILINN